MSDERLRDLERRWRSSGSDNDEAAFLVERVRVGDLSKDRLRCAAAFDHVPAKLAVGESPACANPLSWANALDVVREPSVYAYVIAIIVAELAKSQGIPCTLDLPLIRRWVSHSDSPELSVLVLAEALKIGLDFGREGVDIEWRALGSLLGLHFSSLVMAGESSQFATVVEQCQQMPDNNPLRQPSFKQTLAGYLVPLLLERKEEP